VTPKDAWDKLKSQYAKPSLTRRLMLRTQFHNLKMQEGESVLDHINKLQSVADQLGAIGDKVDEDLMVITLLAGLPSSWSGLIVALDNSYVAGGATATTAQPVQATLTFASASQALLREEERRAAAAEQEVEAAFHTRTPTPPPRNEAKGRPKKDLKRGSATIATRRGIGHVTAVRSKPTFEQVGGTLPIAKAVRLCS